MNTEYTGPIKTSNTATGIDTPTTLLKTVPWFNQEEKMKTEFNRLASIISKKRIEELETAKIINKAKMLASRTNSNSRRAIRNNISKQLINKSSLNFGTITSIHNSNRQLNSTEMSAVMMQTFTRVVTTYDTCGYDVGDVLPSGLYWHDVKDMTYGIWHDVWCRTFILIFQRCCDKIILIFRRYCDEIILIFQKCCDEIILIFRRHPYAICCQ